MFPVKFFSQCLSVPLSCPVTRSILSASRSNISLLAFRAKCHWYWHFPFSVGFVVLNWFRISKLTWETLFFSFFFLWGEGRQSFYLLLPLSSPFSPFWTSFLFCLVFALTFCKHFRVLWFVVVTFFVNIGVVVVVVGVVAIIVIDGFVLWIGFDCVFVCLCGPCVFCGCI